MPDHVVDWLFGGVSKTRLSGSQYRSVDELCRLLWCSCLVLSRWRGPCPPRRPLFAHFRILVHQCWPHIGKRGSISTSPSDPYSDPPWGYRPSAQCRHRPWECPEFEQKMLLGRLGGWGSWWVARLTCSRERGDRKAWLWYWRKPYSRWEYWN